MNTYEDIRVLLTRLDSIAAETEYQPLPESAEIIVEDHQDFHKMFGYLGFPENELWEAEYQGRKVPLNKPMRGDVKKFKVYVKDPKTGNVKKVSFGHGGTSAKKLGQKTMRIKKYIPGRRKSFRARHNCANPGPKTKARYWSCRAW
jgi:hypothetical protein